MACSNCFNGCTEITSDKCVRYTGPNIELLGINNGDTLLTVENALITYLLTALDGTGITPFLNPNSLCDLINNNLPSGEDFNLVEILDALLKSICSLQTQITDVVDIVDEIESDYTIGCLTGVSADSGTHDILQATIVKLCALDIALTALTLDLETNYVRIDEIDNYIENYLISISESTLFKTKMIPYVAMEYYGPLAGNFDSTGAGLGNWVDVYLCNGDNGTPDKRGRVPVGATSVPGIVPMDSQVNPGGLNPTYTVTSPAVSTKAGTNSVTLTETQIPSHTHTATVSTEPDHTHSISFELGENDGGGTGQDLRVAPPDETSVDTDPAGEHSHTVTISNTGGDGAHTNTQPSLACYYIIYLP